MLHKLYIPRPPCDTKMDVVSDRDNVSYDHKLPLALSYQTLTLVLYCPIQVSFITAVNRAKWTVKTLATYTVH